jgi:hypothetical protein
MLVPREYQARLGGQISMSAIRSTGYALAGLLFGGAAGGGLGLLGGLAYTTVCKSSDFEGYSGFVVLYWIIGGIIAGLIGGVILGLRLSRR